MKSIHVFFLWGALLVWPLFSQSSQPQLKQNKIAGSVNLSFTEQDLSEVATDMLPIYFKDLKNIQGDLFIDQIQQVRVSDDEKIAMNILLKGRNLVYKLDTFGVKTDINIGNVDFKGRLEIKTSFRNGKIFYQIALSPLGKETSTDTGLFEKFVLALLSAYLGRENQFISGESLLGGFLKYNNGSGLVSSTLVVRSYQVKNKTIKLTLGFQFKPLPLNGAK